MCDKSTDYSMRVICCDLQRHLKDLGEVKQTIKEFAVLESNFKRVDYVYSKLQRFGLFPELKVNVKSVEVARELRQEGNQLFKFKKDKLAFLIYTKSIANAPIACEDLGLAFANRSAVLFENKRYEECLKDIALAYSNNYPERLYEKLEERKKKCELLRLNQSPFVYHQPLPSLTSNHNNTIECASDSIEIKNEKGLGRHIIATRDISVGEIITLESPFCSVLLKENYSTHCYECLLPSYNLIACNNCPLVMFCGENCKRNAWNKYHKYECLILDTLLNLKINTITLVAMKICIIVGDISKIETKIQIESTYKSQSYPEIHNLISNSNLRTVPDLFERSVITAVIFELVRKYTDYFKDGGAKQEETFKDLLLHHMQTGPSNFHEISELLQDDDGTFERNEYGAGAYGFLSLLNHSCFPNIMRNYYGDCIVVRTIMPVAKGEQLFDNYGYHQASMSKKDRQENLKRQYLFDCECEACTQDWPLFQNLPEKVFKSAIPDEDMASLLNGCLETANKSIKKLEEFAHELDKFKPCKELSANQEILKQCYSILANKRSVL